uniref:Transmembrane protein n=1 Tax=Meloidogyne incognita TaxID=6306 RepID=A0A914N936_MELIC
MQNNKIIIVILILFSLNYVNSQQAYCWDLNPCIEFNCPQIGPRLCPPENVLIYYDCCPTDGCCPFIKWPNLLFLIFIIILLIAGCICCGFFLLTDARQKVFHRKQREEINNQRVKRETGKYISGFNHKKSFNNYCLNI